MKDGTEDRSVFYRTRAASPEKEPLLSLTSGQISTREIQNRNLTHTKHITK